MIKYLKKLWKKWLGKKKVVVVKPIPKPEHSIPKPEHFIPKPEHCVTHSRFIKGCPNCQEAII